MPAPPMMYYPPPPILHQMPGNTFPHEASKTGAGAGAQSHIQGSMMTAPSVPQVQQNSGLSSQHIYQMQQLADAQYNIKPPRQQHVYTPQAAHQPQQQHAQSQPKRRTAHIKIINPDTNSEIDMSSTQSTSSGVSSVSSSTTRLSDHADTQDKENPIAKEFREKVHGSMMDAIIKSPTETKAPVSTVDQSLDNTSLEHFADEAKPDRLAEQPTATLPPEVSIQSNKGDSLVAAAQLTAAISCCSSDAMYCLNT